MLVILQGVTELPQDCFVGPVQPELQAFGSEKDFWNLFLNSHQNRIVRLCSVLPFWLIISLWLFHFNLLWINLSSPSSSFLNIEKHLKLVKQAWWWFHAGCYQLKHWQALHWSVITLENVNFSRCLNILTQWETIKMLPDSPGHLKMSLKLNTIILPITRQGHTQFCH